MKKTQLSLLLVSAVCAFSGCANSNRNSDASNVKKNVEPKIQKVAEGVPSVLEDLGIPYEETYYDYDEHYSEYNFQNLEGDELKYELHKYFIQQHRTYITYGNYWYYANTATDIVPNTELNELFYTGKQTSRVNRDKIDREHVWACSKSNGLWTRYSASSAVPEEHNIDNKHEEKYWGGGSDLFHIRPASGTSINQKRSDAAFYDWSDEELSEKLSSGDVIRLSDGGKYVCYVDKNKNYFEVDDKFKGDIARILMYIWVHYTQMGSTNVYYSPTHTPVYDISEAVNEAGHDPYVCGYPNLTEILGWKDDLDCFRALIRWNRIDPPSEVEANRNNYVESIQGNRNPFIDYPQLVDKVFADYLY